jgi:hypothetical protein
MDAHLILDVLPAVGAGIVKNLHIAGEFIEKTPGLNIFHDTSAKIANFFTHAPSIPGMEVVHSNNPFGFLVDVPMKALNKVANSDVPHINFGDWFKSLFDGGKGITDKIQPLAKTLFKQEVLTNALDVTAVAGVGTGVAHGVGTSIAASLGHQPSQAVFTRPINALRSFAGVGPV